MFIKKVSIFFLFLFSLVAYNHATDKADIIIFSYNRPMQLYALLESLDTYVTGAADVHVIYRSDNVRFNSAYTQVNNAFPAAHFHKQGVNPYQDFKPMTEAFLASDESNYLLFAVDDIIVTDFIDLHECIKALQKTGAYGFYFRLGTNLTDCYMLSRKQPLPPLTPIADDVHAWTLGEGIYDWGYPNTVDLTLYKKSDIVPTIRTLLYHAPNTFEGAWAYKASSLLGKKGLCFTRSKMVNIPMNLTQKEFCTNRNMHGLSPKELLVLFEQGLKIDIAPLHKIDNKSAHMEYMFTFINRE